jgi:hypothetical protein
MRVFYGMQSGHAHRYQCRGDDAHVSVGLCIGIGGVRVDRAIVTQMLEAVSARAVEAALLAADQASAAGAEERAALERELEAARYDTITGRTSVRSCGPEQAPCCERTGSSVE